MSESKVLIMINEDRVKKMYKIALYEQEERKEHREVKQYYQSDYIGKEVIKSLFAGTIAYVVMAILWVMGNWSEILRQINNLEIIGTIKNILIVYAIFLVIYLIGTGIVYAVRYKYCKEENEGYVKQLKRLYHMYEREEKLR